MSSPLPISDCFKQDVLSIALTVSDTEFEEVIIVLLGDPRLNQTSCWCELLMHICCWYSDVVGKTKQHWHSVNNSSHKANHLNIKVYGMEEYAKHIFESKKSPTSSETPANRIVVLSNGRVPHTSLDNSVVFYDTNSDGKLIGEAKITKKVKCNSKKRDADAKWELIGQLRNAKELVGPIDSYLYLCGLCSQQGKDIVTVPQIFTHQEADVIKKLIPFFRLEWIPKSIYPLAHKAEMAYYPRSDTVDIYAASAIARTKAHNKEFAYVFSRTHQAHVLNCSCVYCAMIKLFDTPKIKQVFETITGQTFDKYGEAYLSIYEQGDFLTIHHDEKKGDYTFILSLTDNWHWTDGGLTVFLTSDKGQVKHVLAPSFGSLTVFKVEKDQTTHHFVSEVTAPKIRYTYTGWFNVVKDNAIGTAEGGVKATETAPL